MNIRAQSSCGIAGWGVVRIPWTELPRWRKSPGAAEGLRIAHLRLADEQAVLGVAAILQAAQRAGMAPTGFVDWGVLAAPKHMGRVRLAHGFSRFRKQGPRSASPLIIPTLSQHAVASTVCLILGCHGPHMGVGGGTSPFADVVLNALSIFAGQPCPCPGIWAVMTAWDPEPTPDGAGDVLTPTTGIGVALALVPQSSAGAARLVLPAPGAAPQPPGADVPLTELADFLEQPQGKPWRCAIWGGGCLEILPTLETAAWTLPKAG